MLINNIFKIYLIQLINFIILFNLINKYYNPTNFFGNIHRRLLIFSLLLSPPSRTVALTVFLFWKLSFFSFFYNFLFYPFLPNMG